MKDHFDPKRRLWQCPVCDSINAWNWQDAERAERMLNREVAISHGSCFDNVCGHCHANFAEVDSPIMAECYTHVPREELLA